MIEMSEWNKRCYDNYVWGRANEFLASYLSNSQISEVCNWKSKLINSNTNSISHILPEGSASDPILFSVYHNNQNTCKHFSTARLFANNVNLQLLRVKK